MAKKSMPYEINFPLSNDGDFAANLAMFLTANVGSCLGRWFGTMPASDQRRLFGRFLGKGRLTIDGDRERLIHTRKVCFGTDFDTTDNLAWRELVAWG